MHDLTFALPTPIPILGMGAGDYLQVYRLCLFLYLATVYLKHITLKIPQKPHIREQNFPTSCPIALLGWSKTLIDA